MSDLSAGLKHLGIVTEIIFIGITSSKRRKEGRRLICGRLVLDLR